MITMRDFHREMSPYKMKHRHAEGQLFLLRKGLCNFTTASSAWLMTPYKPCWIPPNEVHETETLGHVEGTSFMIDENLCRRLPSSSFVMKGTNLILAVVDRLRTVTRSSLREGNLFEVLLDEIAEGEPDRLHLPLPRNQALRNLASAIYNHPNDRRSMEEWCTKLDIPGRTFIRRFKDETGLTFVDWRRRCRIVRAIAMMREGHGIDAIATKVGYHSASSFITSFRRMTGTSPHQFAIENQLRVGH